ncbi:MAG: DoxX family membrane protein [Methylobacterium mesophilicum]|nr:DoxX family membrane protein [Methylobacterium mesophilicum]
MLVGRVIFGAFFLIAGIRNLAHFRERYAGPTNYGWRLPAAVMGVGFAIQLLGGLAIIFGVWVIPAALALIVFLVVATSCYHNPLMFPRGERDLHIYLVLVNITLIGGLLMVMAPFA